MDFKDVGEYTQALDDIGEFQSIEKSVDLFLERSSVTKKGEWRQKMMTVASDSGRQPRGIRPVFSPLFKQIYKCGWPGADELKSVHEQFLPQREVLRPPTTFAQEERVTPKEI